MKTQWILQLLIYMFNTGSNVLKTRFNEVRPVCCFFSTNVKFNRIRDAFWDSKMDLENSLKIAKNFNFSLSFHRFGEFTACLILMMYHHKRENIETTKPMKTQWKTTFLKDFKRISKAHLGALKSIINSVEFHDRWKKNNTFEALSSSLCSVHLFHYWTCKWKVVKSIGFSQVP